MLTAAAEIKVVCSFSHFRNTVSYITIVNYWDSMFYHRLATFLKKKPPKLFEDRVYWFGSPHIKTGISPELNILFVNEIHQIEGNRLLDMKEKVLSPYPKC